MEKEQIRNKKVYILGMAKSGIAIAKFLSQYQNEIVISNNKVEDEKVMKELEDLGITVHILEHQEEILDSTFQYVIKNPGIRNDHPAVLKARELGIPVINEMEASYSFLPPNITIIGITGSNGKTTTTTICYELLKKAHLSVHLGGNIGVPLSQIVNDVKENDILVLEISDHQLNDMYSFKTDISVLTNLSEVHLDFHGSYEQYKNIKKRIFNHHTKESMAILNQENEDVLDLTKDIPSKKIYFSSKNKADAYIENNKIFYQKEEIMDCQNIQIKGMHNYENILVGIIIAKHFHVSNEVITSFLKTFPGVEHRLEFVKELHGRKFYNDSKATNNQSTIIALDSFAEPTLLIMGGLDRNIPFDSIAPHLKNVKCILAFGETKEKIKAFAEQNKKDIFMIDTLEEAIQKAYEISTEGDVILLSPACASWDQYPNFEIRGQEFKKIVHQLK